MSRYKRHVDCRGRDPTFTIRQQRGPVLHLQMAYYACRRLGLCDIQKEEHKQQENWSLEYLINQDFEKRPASPRLCGRRQVQIQLSIVSLRKRRLEQAEYGKGKASKELEIGLVLNSLTGNIRQSCENG